MSTPSGTSGNSTGPSPYTGYQVQPYGQNSQYYGGQTLQRNNDSAWGGPQLRSGGTDVGQNMAQAGQMMPGAPYWLQQQMAGASGAPYASNPMEYGRWNWSAGMKQPLSSGGNTGTPAPAPGGQPLPPQPVNENPGPVYGGNPQTGGSIFTQSLQNQMSQTRNANAPVGGDIWSNPAFANNVAGISGGTRSDPWAMQWNGTGWTPGRS